MKAFLVPLVSSILAGLLGFPLRRLLLQFDVIDNPTVRSSHAVSTPRGGGLSIIVSLLVTFVVFRISIGGPRGLLLPASVILIASVSFADDVRSLSSSVRFLCQAGAAVMTLFALHLPISQGTLPSTLTNETLAICAVLIWLVGYTNAFNFMDGINGLAAVQAVLTGIGSFLLAGLGAHNWQMAPALICLAVAGAAAGFLPHNALRPRMFMGDVGSAPLGFLLAGSALFIARDAGWWLLPPLLLLHANFVLDTSITLVRRIVRGDRWLEPHREHFYQRAVRSGMKHLSVSSIEAALQLAVIALMMIYVRSSTSVRVALGAVVVAIWLCFFAWTDCRFRAKERGRALHSGPLGLNENNLS